MLAYSLSLQHEWCLLLISLVLWATLAPMAPAFPLPDSNPLYQFDGQVRLRHLYTSDEQTVRFLEITLDGKVQHSRYKTPFTLMELKAVKPGIISIRAHKTSRFLCMKPHGHLYGSIIYSEKACNFRESLLPEGYNTYHSDYYNFPINLDSMGAPSQNPLLVPFSRFLPLDNSLTLEPEDNYIDREQPDTDSSDPWRIMAHIPGFRSPSNAS